MPSFFNPLWVARNRLPRSPQEIQTLSIWRGLQDRNFQFQECDRHFLFPNDDRWIMNFDELAKSRLTGENRCPENFLVFEELDSGFRRNDDH